MEKRRIAFLIGSDSDLWQMIEGLELLLNMEREGKVELLWVDPASQHRRTLTVQSILFEYSRMPADKKPHFIITAAGWANHLSGCSDAFLRYTLKDETIVVIAVAMEDPKDPKHTSAAIFSTSEVPGIQAIFMDYEGRPLVGKKGFMWACFFAATEQYIPAVFAKIPPEYKRLTVVEAIQAGKAQYAKRVEYGMPV